MRSFPCFPVLLIAAGVVLPAQAQIYGGADSRGTVVLSNFSTEETPELVIARPAEPAAPLTLPGPDGLPPPLLIDPRNPAEAFRPMVDKVARETSVPAQLINAVIRVESDFQPAAVSSKGAQGLMQLMPATAQRFGVRNAFDPEQNIRGGALYLKWLLEYFRGDVRLTLAAYNAGEAAVVRAGYRVPRIAETLSYVPKVLWFYNRANG